MATTFWFGNAPAVAQVAAATFATYDATTTRTITIGGVAVSAVDSGGNLTAALAAFAVVLNAGLVSGVAHPYFKAITWTSNATQIIGTATTAGVPFVFAGSVSGGTGTVSNAYAVSTASAGPNDWSTAANWSGGAVPVNGDIVYLTNSAVHIAYGLAQSAVTLAELHSDQTFTGRVGLDYTNFATSVDALTVSTTVRPEYRTTFLQISATLWIHGDSLGISAPSGSARFCIDLGANASTANIINTASSSADSGRPCVRILCNHASTVINVRSGTGGVGIAAEKPSDTSTLPTINCTDTSGQTKIITGYGINLTTFNTTGGNHILKSNNAITTVTCNGGTLRTEGTGATTTLNVNSGTVTANATGTITTVNCNGGQLTGFGSSNARTWTTVTMKPGATLSYDPTVVTLTNKVTVSGRTTLTAS